MAAGDQGQPTHPHTHRHTNNLFLLLGIFYSIDLCTSSPPPFLCTHIHKIIVRQANEPKKKKKKNRTIGWKNLQGRTPRPTNQSGESVKHTVPQPIVAPCWSKYFMFESECVGGLVVIVLTLPPPLKCQKLILFLYHHICMYVDLFCFVRILIPTRKKDEMLKICRVLLIIRCTIRM